MIYVLAGEQNGESGKMASTTHFLPPQNPRPTSSIYSDDESIMADLMGKLTEEIRLQEYHTIAAYRQENRELEEELALYRTLWNRTITLANNVIYSVAVLERHLKIVDIKVAGAEKKWLAFWGIYKESSGSHPAWI